METTVLKRFAQAARRTLTEQVAARVNLVLMPQSAARREAPQALAELEKEIKEHGQHAIIEKVAYTWFNRFCALRFMDVNGYNSIRMVSPLAEQTQPEILAEAKMGHIDERIVSQQTVHKKSMLCLKVACLAIRQSKKPIVCCWWLPVITGNLPCLLCLSALPTIPNCWCPMICYPAIRY